MMHRKGLLFARDSPVTAQILAPDGPVAEPRKPKSIGRKVPNFNGAVGNKERFKIVVEENYLKSSQNTQSSGNGFWRRGRGSWSRLVRAIGSGAWDSGRRMRPRTGSKWGLNLLGKALMEVQERLRKEEADAEDFYDYDGDD